MKTKDLTALHQLSVAELTKKVDQMVVELAKAKVERAAGRATNSSLVSRLADDVARVKTILTHQLAESSVI